MWTEQEQTVCFLLWLLLAYLSTGFSYIGCSPGGTLVCLLLSYVFLPVCIGRYFNLLVPEVSILQPQQLKHRGAVHFSFE